MNDLAAARPAKARELAGKWNAMAEEFRQGLRDPGVSPTPGKSR